MALTVKSVLNLKDPGKYGDGGGLYLIVDKSGAKRWMFNYQLRGKRREMGLGSAELIGLGEARDKRDEAKRLVGRGIDPIDARRGAAAALAAAADMAAVPFFGDAAKALVAGRRFGSEKYRKQYLRRLTDLLPSLQPVRVDEVTAIQVRDALLPHWERTPDQAERCRGQIELVLYAARSAGHILGPWENPARWTGHMQFLLQRVERTVSHYAALPYDEIGGFMARLRGEVGGVGALALEFTILTCTRTDEIRFAKRGEIDLSEKVWTIPAERMKMGREHRVPLTDDALAVLKRMALREINDPDVYVFPNAKREALSNAAMDRVLDRMGLAGRATVHGFRSTFRDYMGDQTDHAREMIEHCLAHILGDEAEKAYRRGDALDKRRTILEDWAARCANPAADKVVKLKEAA